MSDRPERPDQQSRPLIEIATAAAGYATAARSAGRRERQSLASEPDLLRSYRRLALALERFAQCQNN